MNKEYLEKRYELLVKLFGVDSSSWDMIYGNYNSIIFSSNKKDIIAEYLIWEEFVEQAKQFDVAYYCGIDEFLEDWKKAVYSCLTNLKEGE